MTGLLDRQTAPDDETGDEVIDLTELSGRPVVTLGGDDPAGIDEPIVEGDATTGFTLQKRTLFGGALDATLPLENVIAIGEAAIVVADELAFVVPEPADDEEEAAPIAPSLRIGPPDVDRTEPAVAPATFRDVRARDVVTLDTGDAVGRVDRFVVDPTTRSVGSIRLDKVSSDVRFLSWRDITEFGEDVVTIPTVEVLRKPDGPRENGVRKDFRILGKAVLTDEGRELGDIDDVEFDRTDGRLTALLVGDQRIDGSRLRGVGPFAVVVTA